MKSLKGLEKKLYFKIAWHAAIILIIASAFLMFFNIKQVQVNEFQQQKDSIISTYTLKIAKRDSIDAKLREQQLSWQKKIDSLENEQGKLITIYGQKIQNLYDATAIDHAVWLDSLTVQLNSRKK